MKKFLPVYGIFCVVFYIVFLFTNYYDWEFWATHSVDEIEECVPQVYDDVDDIPDRFSWESQDEYTSPAAAVERPQYKMSSRGHDLIKEFEQCRLTAYVVGNETSKTIGWGHVIRDDEEIPDNISQADADRLFRKDIDSVDASINVLLSEVSPLFKPSQGFVDGIGSLIYNCGEDGVRNTRFFSRLKKCRYDENGNIIKKDLEYTLAIVKDTNVSMKGHKPRRIAEYELMCN